MFERYEPGTNPDCNRPIHEGTVQPAVAELAVDGEPLCLHHAKAGMPVAGVSSSHDQGDFVSKVYGKWFDVLALVHRWPCTHRHHVTGNDRDGYVVTCLVGTA